MLCDSHRLLHRHGGRRWEGGMGMFSGILSEGSGEKEATAKGGSKDCDSVLQ
jgi:hypothetical protein